MQKAAKQGEKELEAKRKDYLQQSSELQESAAQFEQKMAAEVREREKRQKEIPPDILSKYHMLLEKRQGSPWPPYPTAFAKPAYESSPPALYRTAESSTR